MKTLAEQLGGFRFNKSLAFNVGYTFNPYVRSLLFEKADEVRLAVWISSFTETGGLIELPASRDDMTIVKTRIVDKIDPPRFFPLIGMATSKSTSVTNTK